LINSKISFFSVCTFNKARFIPDNYRSLHKLYKDIKYSVIVPKREIIRFKEFFKSNNLKDINIINEEKYISLIDFKEILLKLSQENNINLKKEDLERIGWYYQQILKLSFLFVESNNSNFIIMIDSDTILLKKLNLFKDNHSIISYSNYERNSYYLKSCEYIFKKTFINWKSSTVQLFAINKKEILFMRDKLENFLSSYRFKNCSFWLSEIILKTVLEKYNRIEGSLFSEQDLLAISNQLNGSRIKEQRIFIRSNVFGLFNERQKKFAALLGYEYLTYEEYFLKKENLNFIDLTFILIINYPFIYNLLKKLKKLTRLSINY
tara:strand:+ start:21400 stop:22362 length:963 start_codon:yes stop_codon:yes gene_type:complete